MTGVTRVCVVPDFPRTPLFDISADRRRALLSDPSNGRALEIRLADGEVLNVFRQTHDLSGLPGFLETFQDNAWLFSAHGVRYANGWAP